MLIGGDDISNDVFTPWHVFFNVYIRAHFCFALIGGSLTVPLTRSHRGIGGGIQIPEAQLQALLPSPHPSHPPTPRGACLQATVCRAKEVPSFISYFKTQSIGPALGIELRTSHSAVKRSTD